MTEAAPPLGDQVAAHLIEQAQAGAQLYYAIYTLPVDVVMPLFRDAPKGFLKAYMRAQEAYQPRKRPQ